MPQIGQNNGVKALGYGLYIHVPFCETKCGYCDFFSVALKGRNPAPLVARLVRELRSRTQGIERIRTVFVGGGTPTLLPMDLLQSLIDEIGKAVRVEGLEEFTVEANPATIDDAKARLLREGGVSRISMGVQSFHPAELAILERLHSPQDVAPSIAILRRNGLSKYNLDLIFGIPGQSLQSWTESLRRAIDLEPEHISCYGLTYEPATRLTALKSAGRLAPCDDELEAEMFLATMDVLSAAGFAQYEISNYARPGCQSRHNLIYWRNEPYIGVGPSAAGCLPISQTCRSSDSRVSEAGAPSSELFRRYKNISDIAGYVRGMDLHEHAEAESESVTEETYALEMILMQLRLNEGLSLERLSSYASQEAHLRISREVEQLVAEGRMRVSGTNASLTRDGRLIANRVISRLADALLCPVA